MILLDFSLKQLSGGSTIPAFDPKKLRNLLGKSKDRAGLVHFPVVAGGLLKAGDPSAFPLPLLSPYLSSSPSLLSLSPFPLSFPSPSPSPSPWISGGSCGKVAESLVV